MPVARPERGPREGRPPVMRADLLTGRAVYVVCGVPYGDYKATFCFRGISMRSVLDDRLHGRVSRVFLPHQTLLDSRRGGRRLGGRASRCVVEAVNSCMPRASVSPSINITPASSPPVRRAPCEMHGETRVNESSIDFSHLDRRGAFQGASSAAAASVRHQTPAASALSVAGRLPAPGASPSSIKPAGATAPRSSRR